MRSRWAITGRKKVLSRRQKVFVIRIPRDALEKFAQFLAKGYFHFYVGLSRFTCRVCDKDLCCKKANRALHVDNETRAAAGK